VSVCIPAYNASATIAAAVESVFNQTFSDLEVIVVDDGSSDGTLEILAGLERQDGRLRVHRNPRNLRAPATINKAVELARGEFIKFLDSDDLLEPDSVARLVELLTRYPEATLAFSRRSLLLDDPDDEVGRRWIGRYAEPHRKFGPLAQINAGPDLLERWLAAGFWENWIGEPVCVMAPRAAVLAVGGVDVRIRQAYDLGLWTKLLARGAAAFLDSPAGTYRVRSGSITRSNHAVRSDWLDRQWIIAGLWEDAALRGRERRLRSARRRAACDAVYQYIRLLTRSGRRRRAGELVRVGRVFSYS
jgi:hypothetical protein